MFQSNSRIENYNGIRFYEQDILYDNYIFTNDMQIVLDLDYISPGIGIALMDSEGLQIHEKNEVYLFKLGYKEASVIYRLGEFQKRLLSVATNVAPLYEGMKLIFSKIGKKVSISIDGKGTIFEYNLLSRIDKYNIGIYSNAGNIIKSISIASSIPNEWVVNIANTKGGYIKFVKNGFELEGCVGTAEVEQQNINLQPGKYYIKHDITEDSDIQCFVFDSDNQSIYDEEKNILQSNQFELKKASNINIKYKGRKGSVKNIHITDNIDDKYFATRKDQVTINGSYIYISTEDLNEIEWKGTIINIDKDDSSAILTYTQLSGNIKTITPYELGVYSEEYTYKYLVKERVLKLFKDDVFVKDFPIINPSQAITIFKNMNAIITKLTLIRNDGEVINLVVEKTSKKYVPASITSPIVAIDQYNSVLDLSSSFRVYDYKGKDKYVFTNYEREVFDASTRIRVKNKISKEIGTIKVYGIRNNAKVNEKDIYRIPMLGLDNIDLYCKDYDVFTEKDLYYVDKFLGEIYLFDVSEYKLLVVDYLKHNSYCINYLPDLKLYEVDISTDQDSISLIYDHSENVENVTTISNYITTSINPQESCYIVLREGNT